MPKTFSFALSTAKPGHRVRSVVLNSAFMQPDMFPYGLIRVRFHWRSKPG
jgi:hypothetical protein